MNLLPAHRPLRAGRLIPGLALVILGGVFATLTADLWSELAAKVGNHWTSERIQWIGNEWLWLRWVLGTVFVVLGGSCLRTKFLFYLVSVILIGATVFCVNRLLGLSLSPRPIVLISLALGFMIHAAPVVGPPSLRGIVALALIILASLGAVGVRGEQAAFYDWPRIGSLIGTGWESLFKFWSAECTWAVTVTLAAIGVSLSANRPIHFLNAVLIGVLAYYCIQEGKVGIEDFSAIGKGQISVVGWDYVEPWRWVAAGCLLAVGVGLLHASLGLGAVTAGVGIAWLVAALSIFDAVGTLSAARGIGDRIAIETMHNWGLPVKAPRSRSSAATNGSGDPRNHRRATPSRSARPQPLVESNANAADRLQAKEKLVRRSDRQLFIRDTTALVWTGLVTFFAGLITITGFNMLSEDPSYRRLLGYGLWMIFGLTLGALWSLNPKGPGETWIGWLAEWVVTDFRLHAFVAAFVGTVAIAGAWALRPNAQLLTWIHASIGMVLVGTLLSLIAIAIAIRYGNFPPLPVWTYCVVTILQSALAWALLLYLHLPSGRRRIGVINT